MPQEFTSRLFPQVGQTLANFLGSANMIVGKDKISPSFDLGALASTDLLHYPIQKSLEVKSSNGTPRHYYFVYKSCIRFEDGAFTLDGTFLDVVQDAALVDNGSGSPIIIAVFGDSSAVDGHYWRELNAADTGNPATQWTRHNGATATTAFGILPVGPDILAVTGTTSQGRTLLGEHKIAKCAGGTNPGTATNFAAAEPVGQPGYQINGICAVGDSVIVTKPDGEYVRDEIDKMWRPVSELVKNQVHGVNGKVCVPGDAGSAIIGRADGTLWEFDGNMHEITPFKDLPGGRASRRGRCTAAAHHGDVLAVVYDGGLRWERGPIALVSHTLRVIKRTGATPTFTELTTEVTDGSLATPASANMSAWGSHANDELIFITSKPVEGFVISVTRNANVASQQFASPTVSDGLGGNTSLGNIRDGTLLGGQVTATATASLGLVGMPPGFSQGILSWTAMNGIDLAQPEGRVYTGIDSGNPITGYHYTFSNTGTTAMTTPTTIDEVGVIPCHRGLPNGASDDLLVSTNNFTHRMAAGMYSEIYFGKPTGPFQYEWSVPYVIPTWAVTRIAWTSAMLGTLDNGGPGLLVLGRYEQWLIAEGQIRDPQAVPYCRNTQFTTTEIGPMLMMRNPQLREPNGSLDPTRAVRLKRLELGWSDAEPEDISAAYVNYIDGRGWSKLTQDLGGPATLKADPGQGGRQMDIAILFQDVTQRDEICAALTSIDAVWEYGEKLEKDEGAETPLAVA